MSAVNPERNVPKKVEEGEHVPAHEQVRNAMDCLGSEAPKLGRRPSRCVNEDIPHISPREVAWHCTDPMARASMRSARYLTSHVHLVCSPAVPAEATCFKAMQGASRRLRTVLHRPSVFSSLGVPVRLQRAQ